MTEQITLICARMLVVNPWEAIWYAGWICGCALNWRSLHRDTNTNTNTREAMHAVHGKRRALTEVRADSCSRVPRDDGADVTSHHWLNESGGDSSGK